MLLRFYQSPFLYLTPLFILGVLFGELATISLDGFFIAFIIGALCCYFFDKKGILSLPFYAGSILLLGAVIIQGVRHKADDLSEGTCARIALVKEVDQGDKIWKKHIFSVESEKSMNGWKARDHEVLVYSQQKLREGDVVLFRSQLMPIVNAGNPGEFDAKAYWYSKNITDMAFMGDEDYTLIDYRAPNRVTQFFRDTREYLSQLLSTHLPEQEASLARALILGDKSKLSGETRESFGNAGAMHVLAISGLHVGIIMYLLFFLLEKGNRWISRRSSVIITLLFLWIFAGVTGWSPSVLRATMMFSLLLLGQQWSRSGNPINTLFFSAFVLLLVNPLLLFEIGFQLSYGAMLGIFLFFGKFKDLVKVRNKILTKAWEGTALGIAAQMFTIPVVLYHFHQFPNYFWITNLGIMCLAGIILAAGLIFFAFHYIPFLNMILAAILSWSLYALLQFVNWVDRLPSGVARGFELKPYEVVLFITTMIFLVSFYRRRKWRNTGITLILIMIASWQWDRYQAMDEAEIVIFNSNSPVIACKYKGDIKAFYLGKKKKADLLIQAYEKVMPGATELDSLENGITQLQLGNSRLQLEKQNNGIRITKGKKSIYVRLRYQPPSGFHDVVLDMPYLESREGHYSLSNGAFRQKM